MKSQALRRGFTLIELLIVVAIIAILAAIAVPNFLEAQVRSKTSRVKSDQRAIATAIESYYVDNNDYPEQAKVTHSTFPFMRDPQLIHGGDSPRHAAGNHAIAFRLSTPIAYVASTQGVFADPFFKAFEINQTSVVNDTRYYNYSGHYGHGRVYDAAQDGGDVNAFQILSDELFKINHWHLRSRGPDNDYERRSNGWADYLLYHGVAGQGTGGTGGIQALYDPTNGTISTGDIVRIGTLGVVNK